MKDTHITLTDTLSERLAAILNQVQRLLLKSDWTGELIQTEPCGKARWERRRRKAACRGSAGTNSKKRRWNMCRKKKKNTYFSCSFSFLFVLQLTFSLFSLLPFCYLPQFFVSFVFKWQLLPVSDFPCLCTYTISKMLHIRAQWEKIILDV